VSEVLDVVNITANDRLALAEAVNSFFALIPDDHAMTGLILEQRTHENDETALMVALSRLLRDLTSARSGAEWLRDFVLTAGASTIRDGIIELTKDPRLDGDFREQAGTLVEEYGDSLGSLVEAGYNGLIRNEVPQYVALLEEATEFLGRNSGQGDLLKNILCSASTLLIVGGMVTTLVPPHIQGPIIAGVGGGAFKVFKCNLNELEQGRNWKPATE
jgi:hypothetical protein